jgi:hypothetical protein
MFVLPVQQVASTKIFASMGPHAPGQWRQTLVYEAVVGTTGDNAMVLPIPVHRAVGAAGIELLNLSSVPAFFTYLRDLLDSPLLVMGGMPSFGAPPAAAPPLPVYRVGSFDVSIVPTLADFGRLSGIFRLGLGALGPVLAQRYGDHAFVVYQIAEGTSLLHPFGVSFVTRHDQLYFPTVHVHDGTAPLFASFDHQLFAQRSRLPEQGRAPAVSAYWTEHVLSSAPFVEKYLSIQSGALRGQLANQDTFVELAPAWWEAIEGGSPFTSPDPRPLLQRTAFEQPTRPERGPWEPLPEPQLQPQPWSQSQLQPRVQPHAPSPRTLDRPAPCPECGWMNTELPCSMCGSEDANPPVLSPPRVPHWVAPVLASPRVPAPTRGFPDYVAFLIGVPLFVAFSVAAAAWGLSTGGASGGTLLSPTTPIVCGGNDQFELDGTSKSMTVGVAVTAREHCRLTLRGGSYRGPIAVVAKDHAIVEITGASLDGSDVAVSIQGDATVKLTQSSLRGPTGLRAIDRGVVEILGGNVSGATAAITAGGQSRVEVKGAAIAGKTVQSDGGRVVVSR